MTFLKEYFQKCSNIINFSSHRMKPGFAYIFYLQISHCCWSFNHSKYNKKVFFTNSFHLLNSMFRKRWVIVMNHENGWFGRAEVLKRALSFLFRMEIYILEQIRMDSIRMGWDPPAWIRNLINCSKLKLSVYRFSTQTLSIII